MKLITDLLAIPVVQRYMSQRLLVALLCVAGLKFLEFTEAQQVLTVIVTVCLLVCLTIRENKAEVTPEA